MRKLVPGIKIASAGVGVKSNKLCGFSADPTAVKVAKQYGVDLRLHRSKQVTEKDVEAFDMILAMERAQIDLLSEMYPRARSKTILFGHWVGISNIDDPFCQEQDAFERTFSIIENAALAWGRKLR